VRLKDENVYDKMSKLATSFPDLIKVHQSLGIQVNDVNVLKHLLRHSYREDDYNLKRKFEQVEQDSDIFNVPYMHVPMTDSEI
jgi:hypothetical protein